MLENQYFPIVSEDFRLTSFKNQVGGHNILLKEHLTSEFVFKPHNKKEADFYELITNSKEFKLKEVTPKYYGMESCPEEKLESVALEDFLDLSNFEETMRLSRKRSLSEQDSPEGLCIRDNLDDSVARYRARSEWYLHLFQKRFNKNNTKFLKLQDLTSKYTEPSVLDIKMGSLAYNKKKIDNQSLKLSESTSGSLGFRICGLSMRTNDSNEFFLDKYWGRSVPQNSICNALAIFFFDGERIRKNLLSKYIKRLNYLHKVINESIGFRFFSTSLLFVYDSSEEDCSFDTLNLADDSLETLKLIDFAHCQYDSESKTADQDLLTGITNLIKSLNTILENPGIKLYSNPEH
jgi:hypothetical protein